MLTEGTWHVEDGRLTHPSGLKGGGAGLRVMTDHAGPGISSFTVATVNPYGGGNEADANVLAASKDMLAALKAAAVWMQEAIDACEENGETTMLPPDYAVTLNGARAVIAKAEGRA